MMIKTNSVKYIYIKVEYLLIILQSKSLNLSLLIFFYMTPLNYKNCVSNFYIFFFVLFYKDIKYIETWS